MGRIPESRAYKVGEFLNTRSELEDDLGREPTAHELADKLKWPVKQVSSMQTEIRKEVPASRLAADTTADKPSREAEVIRLIQYELSPDEQLVMEHTYGLNGKAQLKPGDISTRLGIPASKVSRLKMSIASKMKKYL
jgi:DNA-directed RNA polymerase specialized sigma subunit